MSAMRIGLIIGFLVGALPLLTMPAAAASACTLWDATSSILVFCPGGSFPTTCAAGVSQMGFDPADGKFKRCIGGASGSTFADADVRVIALSDTATSLNEQEDTVSIPALSTQQVFSGDLSILPEVSLLQADPPIVGLDLRARYTSLETMYQATGGRMGDITAAAPFCLYHAASDLEDCVWFAGGNRFRELRTISTQTTVSDHINVPAGLTKTFSGDGVPAFTLDGTAATTTFHNPPLYATTKPKRSVYLPADGLYMQGCTLVTDTALVSGGLIEPYITCGDNDAHGFHRGLVMPDSWDGGTITVELTLINVNASPANNYEIDFSGECDRTATTIATTIATTGEQPALVDFDAGQSCGGGACAQNALVQVMTAAITLNGSCVGGDLLRLQGQVDATNTTTAQVADVKVLGIKMEYSVSSESD